ncbi:type VII secretion target [Prauserella oleivorans]|uniref:Type VII secretion target n=1 Tax=Prauserella oleivorans TaxID=1478153 RepID=A0ABW5W1X5_9PSEU
MAGGQTVDPGKLNAAGSAYSQEGGELTNAGSRIETGVSMGQVGKAWQAIATPYGDAIGKFRDTVTAYGQKTTELGGKLRQAAGAYERGEEVSRDTIASKGV